MSFLVIRNLSAEVKGHGIPVLRRVSLRISPGEVHGLVRSEEHTLNSSHG